MSDALILLPPSEGKAEGGTGPAWTATSLASGPLGADRARLVAGLLATLRRRRGHPEEVLRYASAEVLARAVELDLALPNAATMPALERYTGVVLEGVDLPTLTAAERGRVESSVAFVSGLWGVLGAADPIPDYRVKVGAKVPRFGVLGTWWRSRVTPVVDELARGRLVWDLLTLDHGRVWRPEGPTGRIATVEFTTRERGRRGVSNYHGKLLKGRFVGHLARTDPGDVMAAAEFACQGWRLDPDTSVLAGATPRLVFTAASPRHAPGER